MWEQPTERSALVRLTDQMGKPTGHSNLVERTDLGEQPTELYILT